jgi:hypothetical protein
MPQHQKNTHSEQINRAEMAINNTLADAEIQKAVAACGFPAATMKEGLKLYEAALAALNAEARAVGDQKLATAKADAAQKKAQTAYQMLAKMSRAVFRNEKARLSSLGLTGGMPTTNSAFITASYLLFDNAAGIKEIQDVLSGYGYTPAKLKGRHRNVRRRQQCAGIGDGHRAAYHSEPGIGAQGRQQLGQPLPASRQTGAP